MSSVEVSREHFELTPKIEGPIQVARFHMAIARDTLAKQQNKELREIAVCLSVDLVDLSKLEDKIKRGLKW